MLDLIKSSSSSNEEKPLAETASISAGNVLNVGAVARRLGVSATLIRSWEKLGIARPLRSSSKYRLYTSSDLQLLRRAIYLRKVRGLNAPAILDQLRREGLLNRPAVKTVDELPSIGPTFRKLRLQRGESLAAVATAL